MKDWRIDMAKILLVEDDVMNRDMLTERLEWKGHQVITAGDGAQAVRMAKSEHPALIVMDIGLPIMNGWQATHQIKAMPQTRAIPIIMLTAYTLADDRKKSIAMGCDAFESKPVDFPRLLAKMHTLLERSTLDQP
jgi:CheY-like chemotaxis protein